MKKLFLPIFIFVFSFAEAAEKKEVLIGIEVENAVYSRIAKENIVFIPDIRNISRIREWTLSIKDEDKKTVKTFSGKRKIPSKIYWNVLTADRQPAADGTYTYDFAIIVSDKEKFFVNGGKIIIDSTPPFASVSLSDPIYFINAAKQDGIFIFLSCGDEYKIDYQKCFLEIKNSKNKAVKTFSFEDSIPEFIIWNLEDDEGQLLSDGNYLLTFNVADAAGNNSFAETELILADAPVEESGLKENLQQTIYFESGKADLSAKSIQTIQYIADILKENSKNKAVITGHIGFTAAEKKVKKLSENRAKAVYNLLTAAGIDSGRIAWQDLGAKRHIATAGSAKGKNSASADAQNSRAEITILKIQD
ncbi:MAG: OmpA family protein [Elusimicrobiota bacterium]|jgi:outer membrane protein OmpA-like peptidoglycan-associated protein|nr:OmpA family protein [Elusimicrobiota bacterium]